MSSAELEQITPRAFFNKLEGYNLKEREAWERTRWQMWAAMVPYTPKNKTLTVTEVLPLPWDQEGSEKISKSLADKVARKNKVWEALDKKMNEEKK